MTTVIRAALVAFAILVVGQGLWGTMAFFNLRVSPAVPWSAVVMAGVLWILWRFLGRWPDYLRARPVPARVFIWAVAAGALAVVALTGWWIVMFQLVKMPGNLLPDMSKYPLPTLVVLLAMGSLAAPFSEEAAFRGYAQVMLERRCRAPAAILISSVLFALAHGTQGWLLPKLFVYFLAGLAFGVTAYLTQSIIPGIVVHIVADVTFFTLVWPYDGARRLVFEGGADAWFWIHAAQAAVFTVLAIVAYRRLSSCRRESSLASQIPVAQQSQRHVPASGSGIGSLSAL